MGGYMIIGRQSSGLRLKPQPSITVKVQIPGYGEVAIDVPGKNADDARDTLIEWLQGEEGDSEWRTLHAVIDGQSKDITFRASWVSGFGISRKRT